MTEFEKAWIAGFFDAEGGARIKRTDEQIVVDLDFAKRLAQQKRGK